jgi:NitT/TauT family transport system substrate-binding protein
MKKFLIAILICLLLFGALTACSGNANTINLMLVDGAPSLTVAKMLSENPTVEGLSVSYQLAELTQLTAALLNGQPDFAIVPINVAALMHNNGSGYRLAAVTTWGILHVVSNQNVSSLQQLKGETIFAFGQSGTPGITLRAVLNQAGIGFTQAPNQPEADKVHIVYRATPADVRNEILANNASFAVLAEPLATAITPATNGQFKAVINIQDEWKKHNEGENYPQAALIFHQRLPLTLVSEFVAKVEASSLYANANPQSAGDLAAGLHGSTLPSGALIAQAHAAGRLPINFTRAEQAKSAVNSYLQIILSDAPTLVGGKMPSDNFFYI